MAYIGMRYPVAAPVTSHTDGSAITYGTGFVIGNAVAANISFDVNDNPDYGDDIMIDNDTGISGYKHVRCIAHGSQIVDSSIRLYFYVR